VPARKPSRHLSDFLRRLAAGGGAV